MDNLLKISTESIIRYFKTLSIFGYKSYNEVYKLIALLSIEDFLNIFDFYITEDDLRDICKAVSCLYGSTCLIDFIKCNIEDSISHDILYDFNIRDTEDNNSRITEQEVLRKV